MQGSWELLADYIKTKGRYTELLHREHPEAFETWGLITRLYDAYKTNGVESDLQAQTAEILSRASMSFPFDGVHNDDVEKIYLKDLLVYINGELHTKTTASGSKSRVCINEELRPQADIRGMLDELGALERRRIY